MNHTTTAAQTVADAPLLPESTRRVMIATYRDLAEANNALGLIEQRDYCLSRAALLESEDGQARLADLLLAGEAA